MVVPTWVVSPAGEEGGNGGEHRHEGGEGVLPELVVAVGRSCGGLAMEARGSVAWLPWRQRWGEGELERVVEEERGGKGGAPNERNWSGTYRRRSGGGGACSQRRRVARGSPVGESCNWSRAFTRDDEEHRMTQLVVDRVHCGGWNSEGRLRQCGRAL